MDLKEYANNDPSFDSDGGSKSPNSSESGSESEFEPEPESESESEPESESDYDDDDPSVSEEKLKKIEHFRARDEDDQILDGSLGGAAGADVGANPTGTPGECPLIVVLEERARKSRDSRKGLVYLQSLRPLTFLSLLVFFLSSNSTFFSFQFSLTYPIPYTVVANSFPQSFSIYLLRSQIRYARNFPQRCGFAIARHLRFYSQISFGNPYSSSWILVRL